MNATAIVLLSLACPALTAVSLYRANHRKHHRSTSAAVWLVGPAALVAPVIGAQHTHGWGVVGWIVNLITAAACVVHLLPHKKRASKKKPHRKTGQQCTERFLQIPLQAMVQWGQDFWGTHRPWTPKQRPQSLAEHREEIISAMADEARALGRVDVLDDAMAELYQAYGGKK
jgi:hypothetical protein